jgi:hypothetical protein
VVSIQSRKSLFALGVKPEPLAFSTTKCEDEFMFYRRALLLWGLGMWLAGTLVLRVAGQHLLRPGDASRTVLLLVLSFPAAAWAARELCRRMDLPREEWPAAAAAIALPTLLLDPFTVLRFPAVFPNMAPQAAGPFGAWMLWCCAGALVGAGLRR